MPYAKTSPYAAASLVFSLLWLGGTGSLIGVILGAVAREQIDRSSGQEVGSGLAVWGIVLGVVGLVVSTAVGSYIAFSV